MLGFTSSEYSYLRKNSQICGPEKSGNVGNVGTYTGLKGWFVRPQGFWGPVSGIFNSWSDIVCCMV